SEVGGVIGDEADQRRASAVLPAQPEEVEARRRCHSAGMNHPAISSEHRSVDPGVVGAKPRGPDHPGDIKFALIAEADRPCASVNGPRMQSDAVPLGQPPRAGADERLLALDTTADARVSRRANQAGLVQIPEQVAAEDLL